MRRYLVASGGHKHVLSATEACAGIAAGIAQADPGAPLRLLPMADGGEGLIETLLAAGGGEVVTQAVFDPLCRVRDARLGLLADGDTAVIEIAEAAGSALLAPQERQTMVATSYGVGELMAAAVRRGRKRLVIGLGGCIASDMGLGMAQALGVEFYGASGQRLSPFPGPAFNALSLLAVAGVRVGAALRLLDGVRIEVAADVDIPLTGPSGQARTFGPQKGANALEIAWLERGFVHMAAVVRRDCGREADVPLAGAAGGLGAGLFGFLGARLRLGAELVAEAVGLDAAIAAADVVIVGEGCLDATTLLRKAPGYVAARARERGKPVLAVVGMAQPGLPGDLFPLVASCCDFACRDGEPEPGRARQELAAAAARAIREWSGAQACPKKRTTQTGASA